MECAGRAKRRRRFGGREALARLKAPSPLRSTLLLTRIFIASNTIWIRETNSPSPYPLPKEREPQAAALEMSERFRLADRLTRGLPLLGERVG